MNRKITLVCVAVICMFVMLSPWICLSVYAASTTSFSPSDAFVIPEKNSTISFAGNCSYETATLVNSTWVFTKLQLTSTNLTSNGDPLSGSPNDGNLSITAQDCNITVTSFDRLLIPDPSDINNTGKWLTPGWLNYTVNGVGNQTVKMQFGSINETAAGIGTKTWPVSIFAVFIDGRNAPYNNSWTVTGNNGGMIVNGVAVIVDGATSNVSVEYAWYPVPSPASAISPENSPVPDVESIKDYSAFYAILAAIIVFAAVVATDMLLRLKKKQKNVN